MKKETSVSTKLIVMFFVIATVILGAAYLFYRGYAKDRRAELERVLATIAELKVGRLVLWRNERQGDAAVIYGNVTFTNLVQHFFKNPHNRKIKQQLHGWMAHYSQNNEYDQIHLIDSRGIIRMSIPEFAPNPTSISKNMAEALQSQRIQLVDFHKSDSEQHPYLSLLIPIIDEPIGKRAVGLIDLRINPKKYLYPFILRWPTPSTTAETLLVRRDGEDVLYLHALKFAEDAALKLRIPLKKTNVPGVMAVLGQVGIVKGVDYRGIPVIADIRPVPNSPWFQVTRIDLAEMNAPIREQLWLLIAFVTALITAVATGLALVSRHQSIRMYKEQSLAAEALRESEERFKQLFAEAPLGIALKDSLTGQIYEVNPIFAKIVGRTMEEIVHMDWMSITHPDDIKEELDHVILLNKGTINNFRMEKRYLHPNGTIVWSNTTVAPVKVKTQMHPCHLCMIEDITEQRQQKIEIHRLNTELEQRVSDRTAQLASANKELEAFCYSVSHDLRAPLRHIDGYVELLVSRCRDGLSDQGLHYLDTIAASARQMGALIDDLLQFSRTGRAEMRREDVDMNQTLKEAQNILKESYNGRTIEWEIADLPHVRGDYALLRQVWINLIGNAIKFTRPREIARIKVSAHHENQAKDNKDELIFTVADNGVGFDMQYAGKLFGVFQRLHPVEQFEGTGIGLATVQRIIDRHGGRIWAEAELDHGAKFSFILPTIKEEHHA